MDLDDKSIGVAASLVAIIGLVISHVIQVFRTGKEQGRLEGKLAEHDDAIHAQGERLDHYVSRLETMQTEFDEKLNVWFQKIDFIFHFVFILKFHTWDFWIFRSLGNQIFHFSYIGIINS